MGRDACSSVLIGSSSVSGVCIRSSSPFVTALCIGGSYVRSIRTNIRSGGFQRDIAKLVQLDAVYLGAVSDAIGAHGGLREALGSDQVDGLLKDLLWSMQLVQMDVPCTDGTRVKMRHQMRCLQFGAGLV